LTGGISTEFKLTNLGEVKVVFEGFNAEAYGPDGKAFAPAALDKPVTSQPGSTEILTLKVEVGEAALSRFASYLMEGRDRIRVEVRGESIIRVFGSKVTAPLSTSFEISLADILKR
jgi:LEA14-like dessication related protein